MTNQTALERLFALQRLTGANVDEDVPKNLVDRKLPLFVTYEQQGDEDYTRHEQEALEETTTYVMALYSESLVKGTAPKRFEQAREYIHRVRTIFAPRRGLELRDEDGNLSDVTWDATYLGYRGPVEAPYPQGSDNLYLTVYFRIQVGQLYQLDYDFSTTFSD